MVYDKLGPEIKQPYTLPRQRRLAVQEASTALVCTMMPAIEPVAAVSITPRETYPVGHTVLVANEGRKLTNQFTRRYLEEQLVTILAGTAHI